MIGALVLVLAGSAARLPLDPTGPTALAGQPQGQGSLTRGPGQEPPEAAPPRALVFAPPAGTRLARTVVIEHDLLVMSMRSIQNGQIRPMPVDLRVASRQTLAFVDDLRRVEGGRPVLVQRSFGPANYHLELTTGGAAKPQAVRDVKTPLENASVLFTWVPAEDDWGRYYDTSENVEEFLASLSQDLDLLALLPTEPVAPGASWIVLPEKLRELFAPGGKLPLEWPKDLDRQLVRSLASGNGGGLYEVFGGGGEGGARVTFVRVDVVDGDELAILSLNVDATLERDQFDLARERGSLEEPPPAGAIHRAHVRWRFRGRGEIAWNTKAARLASLRLTGDQEVHSRLTLDKDGQVQNELSMKGRLVITAEVAPAK